MHCEEALARLSELEPWEVPDAALREHLEACSACAASRVLQDGLDERVRRAVAERAPARVFLPALPGRRLGWPWAAAAAALLLAGSLWMWRDEAPSRPPPSSLPVPRALRLFAGALALLPGGGCLELSGGAEARLTDGGGALALSRGRCWLETGDRGLRFEGSFPLRVSAGAELELRILDERPMTLSSFLLSQALAGEGASLEVSVLSGMVEGAGLRLPAGQKVRLGGDGTPSPEPLVESDRVRIEGWRAERLAGIASRKVLGTRRLEPGSILALEDPGAPRVLTVGIRTGGAHLQLRTPLAAGAAEVSIGNLPALRDGAWHRLAAWAADGRIEVFLDGRRILREIPSPAESASPGFSLAALGGAVDLKDLRTGRDAR